MEEKQITPQARYHYGTWGECQVCKRPPTRNRHAVVSLCFYDAEIIAVPYEQRRDGPTPLLFSIDMCRRCAARLASSVEARAYDGRRRENRQQH